MQGHGVLYRDLKILFAAVVLQSGAVGSFAVGGGFHPDGHQHLAVAVVPVKGGGVGGLAVLIGENDLSTASAGKRTGQQQSQQSANFLSHIL